MWRIPPCAIRTTDRWCFPTPLEAKELEAENMQPSFWGEKVYVDLNFLGCSF